MFTIAFYFNFTNIWHFQSYKEFCWWNCLFWTGIKWFYYSIRCWLCNGATISYWFWRKFRWPACKSTITKISFIREFGLLRGYCHQMYAFFRFYLRSFQFFFIRCEFFKIKCYCIIGSIIRPKVVKSVHYCSATKKTIERVYTDFTSYEAFPSSNVYPTEVNIYICIFILKQFYSAS